jgi:hypothetical protein
MEITAEVQVSEADYVAAFEQLIPRRRSVAIALATTLIVAFVTYSSENMRNATGLLIGAPGIVLVGLAMLFSTTFVRRRSVKTAMLNLQPEDLAVQWVLSTAGYRVTSARAMSEVKWSAVHRVKDAGAVVLLFTSNAYAQILPKRALTSEQLAQVWAWIQAGVRERQPASSRSRWILLALGALPALYFLHTLLAAR